MKDSLDIIKTARITEKSATLNGHNQYVFEVASKATKQEIGYAVEQIFKKKVVRVNTMNVKGKAKPARFGKGRGGRQAHFKKAIVTLKEGEKLEFV